LWSLKKDANGVLYAGGEIAAKVVRFAGGGKRRSFRVDGFAGAVRLRWDGKGACMWLDFAGTERFIRFGSGEKNVFFDPKSKYSLGLGLGKDGRCVDGTRGAFTALGGWEKASWFLPPSAKAHIKEGARASTAKEFAGGDGTERPDFRIYAQR